MTKYDLSETCNSDLAIENQQKMDECNSFYQQTKREKFYNHINRCRKAFDKNLTSIPG